MISVPKGELKDVLEPGGDLRWCPIWDRLEGRQHAILRCSRGHVAGLRSHSVAADGTVSPSVVCDGGTDAESCTFHEMVQLEGWDPEETRPT